MMKKTNLLSSIAAGVVMLLPLTSLITSMTTSAQSVETCRTVMLTWAIPMTRSDGSALLVEEIAGYTIAYQTASEINEISIEGGDVTSYEFQPDCEAAEYSFSIATIDSSGVKSEYSDTASLAYTNEPSITPYPYALPPSSLTAAESLSELFKPEDCANVSVVITQQVNCQK